MLFLITLCFAFATAVSAKQCDSTEILNCVQPIAEEYQDRTSMTVTKENFQEKCEQKSSIIVCIDNVLKICLNEELPSLNDLFSTMRNFFKDFCKEGSPLREEYLKHMNCTEAIYNDIQNCIAAKMQSESPGRAPDITDEVLCWRLNMAFFCVSTTTRVKCGADAANISMKIRFSMIPKRQMETCNLNRYAVVESSASKPVFIAPSAGFASHSGYFCASSGSLWHIFMQALVMATKRLMEC